MEWTPEDDDDDSDDVRSFRGTVNQRSVSDEMVSQQNWK